MIGLLKEMLLIEEPSVITLAKEISIRAGYFVLPCFLIALGLEYMGKFEFLEVGKKLIVVMVILATFSTLHHKAIEISLSSAEELLKTVSPRNLFLRKWTESKLKTTVKANSGWFERIAIPNLNDLLATGFFLMAKFFIWFLKLIYSTVYHMTYIFAPISALLYFFDITKQSLASLIQGTLWCMLFPFVLVCILAIVGNSLAAGALRGEFSVTSVDSIIWLFGVTLLLLASSVFTLKILGGGGGIAQLATPVGAMFVGAGMKSIKGLHSVFSAKEKYSQGGKVLNNGFSSSKQSNQESNSSNSKQSMSGQNNYSQKSSNLENSSSHELGFSKMEQSTNQVNSQKTDSVTPSQQIATGTSQKSGFSNNNTVSSKELKKPDSSTQIVNKTVQGREGLSTQANKSNFLEKTFSEKSKDHTKQTQSSQPRSPEWNTKTLKPALPKKTVSSKNTSRGLRLS